MMSDKPLPKEALVKKFSESLGIDQAKVLIEQALTEAGLSGKFVFYKEDVLAVSKILKPKGGLISILANCLAAEAYRLPALFK
jgi:hypothetical protein